MNEFLTPDQVQAVYKERAEAGLASQPYELQYQNDHQQLIFFGSVHSNDPNSPQWQALDAAWQRFLDHSSDRKLVFYEGGHPENIDGLSKEEALQKFGEGGLVLHNAQTAGVPADSPEPGRDEEVEELLKQFSVAEVATYYFARQMHQWARQDHTQNPEWKKYAQDMADKVSSLPAWQGQISGLEQLLTWYKEQSGKDFTPNDIDAFYKLSDPYQSKVSAASGHFRDEKLLQAIKDKWQAGDDLFVVYGSGHAIRLEPVLKNLTGKNRGEL